MSEGFRCCLSCKKNLPLKAFSPVSPVRKLVERCRSCVIKAVRPVWEKREGQWGKCLGSVGFCIVCQKRYPHRGFIRHYCRECFVGVRILERRRYHARQIVLARPVCECGNAKGRALACAVCCRAEDLYIAAVRDFDQPPTTIELARALGVTVRTVLRTAPKRLKRISVLRGARTQTAWCLRKEK